VHHPRYTVVRSTLAVECWLNARCSVELRGDGQGILHSGRGLTQVLGAVGAVPLDGGAGHDGGLREMREAWMPGSGVKLLCKWTKRSPANDWHMPTLVKCCRMCCCKKQLPSVAVLHTASVG
jgi:hypothetical protein